LQPEASSRLQAHKRRSFRIHKETKAGEHLIQSGD
jgi:hypothetical protein